MPFVLPTVIVLLAAPVPILMFCAIASLPSPIVPPDELICILPVQSRSTVDAADSVVAPVPSKANDAVPSVRVNALTEVIVIASASAVTAVLSAEPSANVPEPLGSMVMLVLPAVVVMLIASAD